jgi:hypothetical protein
MESDDFLIRRGLCPDRPAGGIQTLEHAYRLKEIEAIPFLEQYLL